jgi:hypothetical protein
VAKNALIQKRFDGGWSPDEQIGAANSFAYSRSIDFRKAPSKLTVLPQGDREGQGVIVDLVQNTVMDLTGKLYAIGHEGFFYRRTTAGVWSSEAKLDNGAFGMSFRSDVDKLFVAYRKGLGEYSPVSNNPTMHETRLGESASTTAAASGGTFTYTLPTVISEAENHLKSFTSEIEPLSKIRVYVGDGGTGNWTLTLHDAANNVLATSTVTNANITDNTLLDFTFSSQVRIYVKPNARTYHFHLTSTVADGTVSCSTAGNLNTCNYAAYADRLIDTKNGMHPMMTFLQYELIGNGNYLAVWEPLTDEPSNLEFLRHRLTFPAGLEVCGIARYQEYAAIACERRTDSGTAQDGIIFFWDGLSSTYNYFLPVPEGAPYSINNDRDVLKYVAGGAEYAYSGGSPYKIRTLPGTDSEYSDTTDTTYVYPYMATVRRGIHLQGFPSYTTQTNTEHGVYSWGAISKDFNDSFGLNYSISTGTRLNTSGNLKLGHIKNYGDTLLMSWRDGDTYGLDRIDNSSSPAASATWESLWVDNGLAFKRKNAHYLLVTFDPLPEGSELVLKYRTTRSGGWQTSDEFTSLNTPENCAKLSINTRYFEMQMGLDITSTDTTPTITSVTLVYDDNRNEEIV